MAQSLIADADIAPISHATDAGVVVIDFREGRLRTVSYGVGAALGN